VAKWVERSLGRLNFHILCQTASWKGDRFVVYAVRYRSANMANSAFYPSGLGLHGYTYTPKQPT